MTTNLGQDFSDNGQPVDYKTQVKNTLLAMREHFRPEFLNRIDEAVIFNPLGMEHIRKIIRIQVRELRNRLKAHKIDISLDESAEAYLAKVGYDPTFGARPLKRVIQHEIQDVLAYKMLDESLTPGDKIQIREGRNGLSFHRVS